MTIPENHSIRHQKQRLHLEIGSPPPSTLPPPQKKRLSNWGRAYAKGYGREEPRRMTIMVVIRMRANVRKMR